MQAFEVTEIPSDYFFEYMTPYTLIEISEKLSPEELTAFIRSRYLENIPFTFKEKPLLYETMRTWLARELKVNPSEIVTIGSAKLGFSPAPHPDFGKLFTSQSDLDLTVISEKLFNNLVETYEIWANEFSLGKIKPNNPTEESYWKENARRLPTCIQKGFIDPNKIPNRYETSKHISQKLWALKGRLDASDERLVFRKCSLRIYKDWTSFSRQLMTNLNKALTTLQPKNKALLATRTLPDSW